MAGVKANHKPSDSPAQLLFCDILDMGDGVFKAVPQRPRQMASVRECEKFFKVHRKTLYRLYDAGFIAGEKPTPRKLRLSIESIAEYKKQIADPEFWTSERRARYVRVIQSQSSGQN